MASDNLAHSAVTPQVSKHGVLCLWGFGLRLQMQNGHLSAQWGIGENRYSVSLPRVPRNLKRVVIVGDDGFVTFASMQWISDVGASLIFLDRRGKLLFVSGPTAPSDARLRRAQALALGNGVGLAISRTLIVTKLEGQERVVREQLKQPAVAHSIAQLRERLADAEDLDRVRSLEAEAAKNYWSAWSEVPILFPRKDAKRIPAHWLQFGSRHSPITGGPRLAINPANAILNYCFALAESECRLALCACGLDPGIGFIHLDTANRDSLALDLLETIRPSIEAWLLNWIMREPLRRSDFFETGNGNCRLMSRLCCQLAETASTWGRLVAPWAEYVTHSLRQAGRTARPQAARGFSTPLTQAHRRKTMSISPTFLKMPTVGRVCHGCGTPTRVGRNCPKCGREISGKKLIELAKAGRVAALRPEARNKHSETQRKHEAAKREWRSTARPAWPDEAAYIREIQPRLASVAISKISSTLGICESYAADIRAGRHCPHPRHWQALGDLLGVSRDSPRESN